MSPLGLCPVRHIAVLNLDHAADKVVTAAACCQILTATDAIEILLEVVFHPVILYMLDLQRHSS